MTMKFTGYIHWRLPVLRAFTGGGLPASRSAPPLTAAYAILKDILVMIYFRCVAQQFLSGDSVVYIIHIFGLAHDESVFLRHMSNKMYTGLISTPSSV